MMRGFFKAVLFVATFLVAMAVPSHAAPSSAMPRTDEPVVLQSLQDQCLARAALSDNPSKMEAICVGWVILALEPGDMRRAKAAALRDACLREAEYGAKLRIRDTTRRNAELCRALYATVAD